MSLRHKMSVWAYLTALGYGLLESAYFGWNPWPKSDAELIADGITLLIFSIACAINASVEDPTP